MIKYRHKIIDKPLTCVMMCDALNANNGLVEPRTSTKILLSAKREQEYVDLLFGPPGATADKIRRQNGEIRFQGIEVVESGDVGDDEIVFVNGRNEG